MCSSNNNNNNRNKSLNIQEASLSKKKKKEKKIPLTGFSEFYQAPKELLRIAEDPLKYPRYATGRLSKVGFTDRSGTVGGFE